jgi:hypothetical protein
LGRSEKSQRILTPESTAVLSGTRTGGRATRDVGPNNGWRRERPLFRVQLRWAVVAVLGSAVFNSASAPTARCANPGTAPNAPPPDESNVACFARYRFRYTFGRIPPGSFPTERGHDCCRNHKIFLAHLRSQGLTSGRSRTGKGTTSVVPMSVQSHNRAHAIFAALFRPTH